MKKLILTIVTSMTFFGCSDSGVDSDTGITCETVSAFHEVCKEDGLIITEDYIDPSTSKLISTKYTYEDSKVSKIEMVSETDTNVTIFNEDGSFEITRTESQGMVKMTYWYNPDSVLVQSSYENISSEYKSFQDYYYGNSKLDSVLEISSYPGESDRTTVYDCPTDLQDSIVKFPYAEERYSSLDVRRLRTECMEVIADRGVVVSQTNLKTGYKMVPFRSYNELYFNYLLHGCE